MAQRSGASPGDTIFIEEGTFAEMVSVPTQDVTLVGRGAGETIIQGQIDVTGSGFGLRETTVQAEPDVRMTPRYWSITERILLLPITQSSQERAGSQ